MTSSKSAVLVADSDPGLLAVIRGALCDEGFSVIMADNGPKALNKLKEQPFDLVIVGLPIMQSEGFDFLARYRNGPQPDVPLMVLNKWTRLDEKVKCLESGADDCIDDPFCFAELLARVRVLVRTARVTRELKARNAELQNFVYSVVHDLRAPLNVLSIRHFLLEEELVKMGCSPGSSASVHLAKAQKSAERIQEIVNRSLESGPLGTAQR